MAAIHFACQKGHTQVVRYLLAAGASVNSSTRKGMTPLHYAIQGGHAELAKLLIKRGGNLDAENKALRRPIDLAKDGELRSFVLAAEQEKKTTKISQEISCNYRVSRAADEPELEPSNEVVSCEEDSTVLHDSNARKHELELLQENRGEKNKSYENVTDSGRSKKKAKVQLSHLAEDELGEGE
eukprot:c23989_g1_i2 orf=737-1285(-)